MQIQQETLLGILARLMVVCTTLPIHEFAHGWVANRLGDDTAAQQGRLTLNPITHIDPVGGLLILATGFGWARPVPVNPARFNRKHSVRGGMAITAAAGPAANILLALALMILMKLAVLLGARTGLIPLQTLRILLMIFQLMILTNISLAVFNLLPVPPLDGYSVFAYFLPEKLTFRIAQYRQIIFILLMMLCFSPLLSTPISFLTRKIFGLLNTLTFFIR